MQNVNPCVLTLSCDTNVDVKTLCFIIEKIIETYYTGYTCLVYSDDYKPVEQAPEKEYWIDLQKSVNETGNPAKVFGIALCESHAAGHGYHVVLGDKESQDANEEPLFIKYDPNPQETAEICLVCIENTLQKFNPMFTVDSQVYNDFQSFHIEE